MRTTRPSLLAGDNLNDQEVSTRIAQSMESALPSIYRILEWSSRWLASLVGGGSPAIHNDVFMSMGNGELLIGLVPTSLFTEQSSKLSFSFEEVTWKCSQGLTSQVLC